MTEENKTQTFKIINKTITATIISNKNLLNHQLKNNNDFMAVFLNNLQKHFYTF